MAKRKSQRAGGPGNGQPPAGASAAAAAGLSEIAVTDHGPALAAGMGLGQLVPAALAGDFSPVLAICHPLLWNRQADAV